MTFENHNQLLKINYYSDETLQKILSKEPDVLKIIEDNAGIRSSMLANESGIKNSSLNIILNHLYLSGKIFGNRPAANICQLFPCFQPSEQEPDKKESTEIDTLNSIKDILSFHHSMIRLVKE